MALTGDFSGMQRLEENLARLAEVPSRATAEAATEITKELKKEFAAGRDPYGKNWAALRPSTIKRGRKPPPLTASGALRDGTEAVPMRGAGIMITVGEPYGVFHQTGTKNMVARPILPSKSFPKTWLKAITDATKKAFAERMKK